MATAVRTVGTREADANLADSAAHAYTILPNSKRFYLHQRLTADINEA